MSDDFRWHSALHRKLDRIPNNPQRVDGVQKTPWWHWVLAALGIAFILLGLAMP